MDCILMAGGIPGPEDPLYPYTQGRPKTLADLAGKPMAQWVIEALDAAPGVGRILVVGLPADAGLASAKIIDYLPDQGGLLSNAMAGIERLLALAPETRQALACCGDIPLITAEMLEWLLAQSPDPEVDLYHCDAPRPLMEQRFPTAGRSYVRFKDVELAGGDVHVASPYLLMRYRDVWEDMIRNRKSMLKQALRLGPTFFIKFLLHRLSLREARDIVNARFGMRVEPVISRYAELAMDVDKPHQLELCRDELAARRP